MNDLKKSTHSHIVNHVHYDLIFHCTYVVSIIMKYYTIIYNVLAVNKSIFAEYSITFSAWVIKDLRNKFSDVKKKWFNWSIFRSKPPIFKAWNTQQVFLLKRQNIFRSNWTFLINYLSLYIVSRCFQSSILF